MTRRADSTKANPYDLNETLKDRKPKESKPSSPTARSPYTLSHHSSLRAAIGLTKKK
jgi:hypothetical protein